MKYQIYHQAGISHLHYLLPIKVNPHLVTIKPTNKQPGHGAVCHTTNSFIVANNILITRLPVNIEMFTIVHR